MKLHRKTHFNGQEFENETTWTPIQDHIRRYRIPRLQDLVDGHYSKLAAIAHPGKGAVTEELCRALLTDTGLLFAQTREHGYPMSYSRRRQESSRKLNLALYNIDAVNPPPAVTDDSTGQELLLNQAKRLWPHADSAARIQNCIRTLLEQCGSVAAFACIEVSGADVFFYCVKDETARSLSGEDDNNCVGGQTVVKKKPENVVTVMAGCLKPYFYFVLGHGAVTDRLQQPIETIHVVRDGEHICQDCAF